MTNLELAWFLFGLFFGSMAVASAWAWNIIGIVNCNRKTYQEIMQKYERRETC